MKSAKEERELLEEVRSLARSIQARENANPDRYPAESIADLVELGVFRAPFPADAGGCDLPLLQAIEVLMALGEASGSVALLTAMPMGLAGVLAGAKGIVPENEFVRFDEQFYRISSEYKAGKIYAACNSERGAGGLLSATRTRAERGGDGVYRLTGEKVLTSFGTYADVLFAAAKFDLDTDEEKSSEGLEFFLVETSVPGVDIRSDWDGFGMRATESHSVGFEEAAARERLGWVGFMEDAQPWAWFWLLFAAIPLGCVGALLKELGRPSGNSAAMRMRLSEAEMRWEAARAYLRETAGMWKAGAGADYNLRVLRTKTFVTQEAVKIGADLFALAGGRHFTKGSRVSRIFADSFAGTVLRPPLLLGLEMLSENEA